MQSLSENFSMRKERAKRHRKMMTKENAGIHEAMEQPFQPEPKG